MTTQKIEFEYTARNESAGSRAWQEGRMAIEGYNQGLGQSAREARQAQEAMNKLGREGQQSFHLMSEGQQKFAMGMRQISFEQAKLKADTATYRRQAALRADAMVVADAGRQGTGSSAVRASDANARLDYRLGAAARRQALYDADAHRVSSGFASSRTRARRASMALEFQDSVLSRDDLAGLGQGDRERQLTTGGYRGRRASGGRKIGFDAVSGIASGARMAVGGLGLAAAGGLLAHKFMEVNHEMIEKADNASEAYDTLSRSLNIQAGLTGAAAQEARKRILSFALDAAADKNFAFGLSTQMVSSGFSAKQATGGALKEMLTGINAMPAPGGKQVDPVALAEAATSYMTSQNMDKTGENLRAVLSGVQQLYKSTNFQLADFSELAGQADTMRGKMTMGEQFGAFSVLRDVGKSAEEATTALRNIALRAQTVAGSSEKTSALASLGLKPEEIDMVGESFQDVLNRLAHAMDGVDPAKVTIALEKVFGERTLAGLLRLVEDREKVKERTDAIGDQTEYEANAKEMSSGPAAAKRRQTMQAETWAANNSQRDDVFSAELKQNALENGSSKFGAATRGALNWGLRGFGVERDTAAAIAFDSFGGDGQVAASKLSLAAKGVDLTVSTQPSSSEESDEERIARRNLTLPTIEEALKVQPNYHSLPRPGVKKKTGQSREEALAVQPNFDSLPRPGAKTSAPAPEAADAIEMKNASLERTGDQQVDLLSKLVAKMDGLIDAVDGVARHGSGVREPRRASSPWDPRRPPPLPAIVSLSASEVG